jgi:hypothetical protein
MAQAVSGRISVSINVVLILAAIIILLWMGFDPDALIGQDKKGS